MLVARAPAHGDDHARVGHQGGGRPRRRPDPRVPHVHGLIPAAAPRHPPAARHARHPHDRLGHVVGLRVFTSLHVPRFQRVIEAAGPDDVDALPRHRADAVGVSVQHELLSQGREVFGRGRGFVHPGHEKSGRRLGVVAVVSLATLGRLLRLPSSAHVLIEGEAGVAVPHANGVVVPARRDAFAPGRGRDALHGAHVTDEEIARLVSDCARAAPLGVHLDAPGTYHAVVAAGDDDAAGASVRVRVRGGRKQAHGGHRRGRRAFGDGDVWRR
mmetsp:Transcript_5671/g.23328  ORF Transcript_5671/g.23328 Transcript_5671/m.23328 type:complete len:271 (-) Transcript_5671:580-1392(-)